MKVSVYKNYQPVVGATVVITEEAGHATIRGVTQANGDVDFTATLLPPWPKPSVPPTPPSHDHPVPPRRLPMRGTLVWQNDMFTPMFAGVTPAGRDAYRDTALSFGDNHMSVSAAFQWRHFNMDMRRHPVAFCDALEELYAAGIRPILMAFPDSDTNKDRDNRDEVARPALRELEEMIIADARMLKIPVVNCGFEFNAAMTPYGQQTMIEGIARLFPAAERVVAYTDDRWAGFKAVADMPKGPMPTGWGNGDSDFWRYVGPQGHGWVHTLGFQCTRAQTLDRLAMRVRCSELLVRLNGGGLPGTHVPYPPLGVRFHLAESFAAEGILTGRLTLPQAQDAGSWVLDLPGCDGALDGHR